jgi:DNA-binding GntR family transcriptional regulator
VLLEGPIAEILQISRAPVQRALQALEADGLVHRFKGRGYLVGPEGRTVEPNRTDIKTLGLIVPQHADEALQSRSSWERIYNIVERDVAGCVVFGQYRIIEIEIANHFNVSRTVVRDVLTRLRERGLVRKTGVPVKVLGRGDLAKKLTVRAHKFSGTAATKIAAAGGVAEVIEA